MRGPGIRELCKRITQISNRLQLEQDHQLQDRLHYGIHGRKETKRRMEERQLGIDRKVAELAKLRGQLGLALDELAKRRDDV